MDLRRFKFVSLILLAVTLLALALGYFFASKNAGAFPASAIGDLVSMLEKGGIHVDASLIPTAKTSRAVYECKNDSVSLAALAVALSGSTRKDANRTADGVCLRMADNSLVTVSDTLTLDLTFGAPVGLDLRNAQKTVKKKLLALTDDSLHVDYSLSETTESEIGYSLCFLPTLDGLPVLDGALVATVENGSFTALYGNAYLLPLFRLDLSPKYDCLNILTAELRSHTATDLPAKTVSAVTECYLCRKADGALRFLPGFVITYTDGSRSVYDSTTGERVDPA